MPTLLVAAAALNILAVPMPAKPVWSLNAAEARRRDPDAIIVELQMAVSPEGRVTQCTSPVPSALNAWACAEATANMRFTPATDLAAKPTYGRFEMGIFFNRNGGQSPPTDGRRLQRWTIKADNLPSSVPTAAVATIALLVSANGAVEQCLMRQLGPRVPMEVAFSLEEKACPILRRDYRADPVLDRNGISVPYVQRIIFIFERSDR